jgi:hypothetical protein
MAYIGNILQKDLADLKSDRIHFATDNDKLSGLKDNVDLGGGETKPQTTPVDHFGVVLSVNTTDNMNYAHLLTIDFGSVA